MRLDLDGRNVLITGAASGIGRAAAALFAEEGANLALVDIDEDGLREVAGELGDRVVGTGFGDLALLSGVEQGIGEALAPLAGSVDVLVNNVGAGVSRTFDQISDEDWLATLNINLLSCIRVTRLILPSMRSAGHGAIVNNASDLARQPEANPMDYAVAKAGMLAFTKALARAEGPAIRVNAVAPGPVWTPFWTREGGFADSLAALHQMPPEAAVRHEISLRHMPLGRLGTAEEVASVIVFLASARASFVTGSVYGVDGGTIRSIT
jgi:NAD(P)-dependent dehydrogenase (short-subunit alcohol dehydrogenase family)